MELGIGMFGDLALDPASNNRKPAGQRMREMLAEIKLADEVGLDVFNLGEHHRKDYAVSVPEMVLAAAAGITKNIRLSSGVTVLSSSDPVRIYQNFASLDLLSAGRAEIMVGRGSFIESFPLFGYDLNDYPALFEEKLDLLLKINNTAELSWKGQFRAELQQQWIGPRAEQESLPIWIAVGGTPSSVLRAATLGLPLMLAIIGGDPAQFKGLIDYYKNNYLAAGHEAAKMQIGIQPHGFLHHSSQEAADTLFPYYAQQMNAIGKDRGWPPFTRGQFNAGMQPSGAYFIGEANAVADKILYYQQLFGLTRFVMQIDVGGADHVHLMRSIELFGTKVAPQIRKALS